METKRVTNDNLTTVLSSQRMCMIHCLQCGQAQVPIQANDVWIDNSLAALGIQTVKTRCPKCQDKHARVIRVMPERLEDIPVLDRQKLTQRELEQRQERSQKKYKEKYGADRLKKDFLQPYVNGEVNPEFVRAYAKEPQKLKQAYSSESLHKAGHHELANEKEKEEHPEERVKLFIPK